MRHKIKPVPTEDDTLVGVALAAALDGIIVTDAAGGILMCNTACRQLFGYRAEEVTALSVTALMPSFESGHDAYLSNFAQAIRSDNRGTSREIVGRHKDGSTFPICLSLAQSEFRGATVFVGVVHTLTSRALNRAAGTREAGLRAILDNIPDAVVTMDHEGVMKSFSPAASLLFGYKPAEVIGRSVNMLMPSPYKDAASGVLDEHPPRRARPGHASESRIVIGRRQDGSTFPMELAIGEVRGGPQRLFTAFVRDITKRQGTEQRLEELQAELLRVSRVSAMGEMTAAVAHEMNQPLTAIANYLNSAKRTLRAIGSVPRAAERTLEMLHKAAEQALRAGSIMKTMRNYMTKRESIRCPESLSKIITESLALAFVGAADRKINVKLDLDSKLAPVMVDKIQVQQVLLNLIRNSMEAMQSAKTRELVLMSGPGEIGFANVTVKDSGPGVRPSVVARLFHPLVSTKNESMGIGLAICQSIIEAQGGSIWLAANTPSGASFRFSVPLAAEMAPTS